MKLGIVLSLIGLAGTLFFLGAAANVADWGLYADAPWLLPVGAVFFIVFLFGWFRFRKALRRRNEDRYRRR